eukprot:8991680-Ditylum_brightwellii.AAC.1
MADVGVGSGFDPPVIPCIPKTFILKSNNSQGSTLYISAANKHLIYRFKVHIFCNRSLEDVLEWEKKIQNMVKCKLVDMAEG